MRFRRVLLVGVVSALVLLAFWSAPRPEETPAWAQGVGIFSRATCTQWSGAVTGQSFCFEQSTNTLKVWTGAAWVAQTATQTGINNVVDFGARGDNITDSTAAIQAAHDALPAA